MRNAAQRCDVRFFFTYVFLISFNASPFKLDWHKLSRQIYGLSIVVVKQQRPTAKEKAPSTMANAIAK